MTPYTRKLQSALIDIKHLVEREQPADLPELFRQFNLAVERDDCGSIEKVGARLAAEVVKLMIKHA